MKGQQKEKSPKNSRGTGLSMVIDSKVGQRDEGIFYLLPLEMSKSDLLNPEKFDSVYIRNIDVDDIRSSCFIRKSFFFKT